ncbi:MAG: chemotaxis protein CheB [Alphaproteobacteria bacterium]
MAAAKKHEAVVIGASAGAVEALLQLLPSLPADYPLPLMLVVHLPPDKDNVLPGLLQARCRLKVREAEDKERLEAGTVYVAPPDYHLLVERERCLSLSVEEPVLFSRPSVDVLFETAADAYGESLIGVILTGASSDGAHGLATVCDAGGTALVLDPAKAYAPVMPEAALAACPQARMLSLPQIRDFLQEAA